MFKTSDFFVVGGPVQPDRPCYISRPADRLLPEGIGEGHFCSVLAPRAMGKSSLLGRVVRLLRAEGQLAAVIDLAQLGAREQGAEAGRWYYSIAYRVMRELRLKADLQTWWQENSVLTREQRLVEFFINVVLAHTDKPITVFIDEIERTLELPYAQELFGTIRAVYNGRATEPEFSRLNFVLLGTATAEDLCKEDDVSPFPFGKSIPLEDFTLPETYALIPGLGVEQEQGQALLTRVHHWTNGQPYLTQKLVRFLSRLSGPEMTPAAVDELVADRFLNPSASVNEPLLNGIQKQFDRRSGLVRQALIVLGKLQKENQVVSDGSQAQSKLSMSGLVVDQAGQLAIRNRIYEKVFTSTWVNTVLPFDLKVLALTGVAVLAMILLPVWYTQILPRPYVETLAQATQDYPVALEAHDKLSRLPGFQGMADRLLSEVMVRRSRLATNYLELTEAETGLERIPGNDEVIEQLRGEFWYRKSLAAMGAEARDEALLYALRSQTLPSGAGAALAQGLVGDDYPNLFRSLRFSSPVDGYAVDWANGAMTVVDEGHVAHRFNTLSGDRIGEPLRLTASQSLPVTRELFIESSPAGGLTLALNLEHTQSDQVKVRLTAPTGVDILVRQLPADQNEFSFAVPPVAAGDGAGLWRLTLVDEGPGNVGRLVRWELRRGRQPVVEDEPEEGLEIPDPIRTEDVQIVLQPGGNLAAALPQREQASGAISIWELNERSIPIELPVAATVTGAGFDRAGTRFFTVAESRVKLFSIPDGVEIASLDFEIGAAISAQLSPDGGFLTVSALQQDGSESIAVVDAQTGNTIGELGQQTASGAWAVGWQAGYVALASATSGEVQLIDPASGENVARLSHPGPVTRLLASEKTLITVLQTGGLYRTEFGVSNGVSTERLGQTVTPLSVAISDSGNVLSYKTSAGAFVLEDLQRRPRARLLRNDGDDGEAGLAWPSDDGVSVATLSNNVLRLWRVPQGASGGTSRSDIASAAMDPSGELFVVGDSAGHVQSQMAPNPRTSTQVLDYIGHSGAVTSLAVLARSDLALSGGADGVVRLWNVSTGVPQQPFMRHPLGPVYAVDISPNGDWLASAAEFGARIWSAEDGRMVTELPVTGRATALAFSEDSGLLAVGDGFGNLQLVAPRATAPLSTLRMEAAISAVAFQGDGPYLAAGSRAGTVQLWDRVTGEVFAEPIQFTQEIRSLLFSRNGEFLVVQTSNWLHRLTLRNGGLELAQTRLAPPGAQPSISAVSRDGSRLRLLAGVDGSGLTVVDVDLATAQTQGEQTGARDWTQVLGLAMDEQGVPTPIF